MKIKTILVDDEPLAVTELNSRLNNHEEIQVVAVSRQKTQLKRFSSYNLSWYF